ncbi:MAG: phosphoglucosamine mutase [Thermoprotei archaeon]|nr:phosphoglucosamine mutase [Thermoprotei archaeon]
MGRLFGTDGVRGLTGLELTPEFALRFGRAIGGFFGPGSRIIVGRDVRAGGDIILSAVVSGLLSEGVKVYNANLIPTPALQYSVKSMGYDGGVMVTASHNPPEYNGIKVIAPDGVEVDKEDEEAIEELYFKGHSSKLEWRSLVEPPETAGGLIDAYVNAIISQVDSESIARRGFKVVVDCANSVGALATPLLLRKLGVKVYSLNCHLDPYFPGREPEPTPSSLLIAASLVMSSGADIGAGHDGDADRAIIVDDKGEIHWGDRTGALLSHYASTKWREMPRRVFTGVSSSIAVEQYLSKHGVEVVWTPVGSVTIARTMVKSGGAIAGFEENGGYMHVPHQYVRDGAMAIALALDMLASLKSKMSDLISALPKYYPVKTKIPMSRGEILCSLEAVKELFSGYRIITIDGVKVLGEDFWILVRPSGTEPVLRIMAEASSREKAENIVNTTRRVLSEKCLGGR